MFYSTLLMMSSIALSGCLIKSLLWRESSKETSPKHIVSSSPFPKHVPTPSPQPNFAPYPASALAPTPNPTSPPGPTHELARILPPLDLRGYRFISQRALAHH